jgi:hypothetical protein
MSVADIKNALAELPEQDRAELAALVRQDVPEAARQTAPWMRLNS